MNKNEIIKTQIKELKRFGFLSSQQICDLLEPKEWLEPEQISGYKRIYSVPIMFGKVPIGISVLGFYLIVQKY